MHIENRIDALLRAQIDDTVEMLEPLLLQHARVVVVLEVAVVDGDADAVQAELVVELGVGRGEEVLEELVEVEVGLLLPDGVGEGLADLMLAAGVARDEVLHVHPASETALLESARYYERG